MIKVCINCNKEFETKKEIDVCSFTCMTEWMTMQYGDLKRTNLPEEAHKEN